MKINSEELASKRITEIAEEIAELSSSPYSHTLYDGENIDTKIAKLESELNELTNADFSFLIKQ